MFRLQAVGGNSKKKGGGGGSFYLFIFNVMEIFLPIILYQYVSL